MNGFGHFFRRVTGRDIHSCNDLLEIEKIVEKQRKRPLRLRSYDSNLIAEHGDVFPVGEDGRELDREIDVAATGTVTLDARPGVPWAW